MGHLNTTATTLVLAFFTITSQALTVQSQSIAPKNSAQSFKVNSTIEYPLAIAGGPEDTEGRGSGR